MFSTMAASVCIPTNSALGFPFLHNLSNLCLLICLCWPLWLVWDGTSLWFLFASLMASNAEHPFICLWALCMSSLEKCLFRSFAQFWLDCLSSWYGVVWVLYIFWTSNSCPRSLTNIFSHMAGSLFILLMFSLAVQKLFNLMKYHLFIVSFMSLTLGHISVKILLCGYLKFSCSCSSLGLLWHCDSHLSLLSIFSLFCCIMEVGCRVSFFFFFAYSCPDLPTLFVEEAIFIPFYASVPFVKD